MRTFKARSKSGELLRLYSDDTFTLAIGSSATESIETTPEMLADIFPMLSLARLFTAEPGKKIACAVIIAAVEVAR